MFAYCGNNSANRLDFGGNFWETAFDVVSLGVSIVGVCNNPTDLWEWVSLAGDTIDLIPFVTGAGELTRTLKITNKTFNIEEIVMDSKQFKIFCENEFKNKGFKKNKKAFYLFGKDVLCGIDWQRSRYSNSYYVNYYFFIGDFSSRKNLPLYYESDIQGRIKVLSKEQNFQAKQFMTPLIEYEKYTENELKDYFDFEFENVILPPIIRGKEYILHNLNSKYFSIHSTEVIVKKIKDDYLSSEQH